MELKKWIATPAFDNDRFKLSLRKYKSIKPIDSRFASLDQQWKLIVLNNVRQRLSNDLLLRFLALSSPDNLLKTDTYTEFLSATTDTMRCLIKFRDYILTLAGDTEVKSSKVTRNINNTTNEVETCVQKIKKDQEKINDYNKNYLRHVVKSLFIGASTGALGLIFASALRAGPVECERLRTEKNKALIDIKEKRIESKTLRSRYKKDQETLHKISQVPQHLKDVGKCVDSLIGTLNIIFANVEKLKKYAELSCQSYSDHHRKIVQDLSDVIPAFDISVILTQYSNSYDVVPSSDTAPNLDTCNAALATVNRSTNDTMLKRSIIGFSAIIIFIVSIVFQKYFFEMLPLHTSKVSQ